MRQTRILPAFVRSFPVVTRIAVALAILCLASPNAQAQADFEKGFQAYQSYHGSDFDMVNLANGNLALNIPLISYAQRGDLPPVVISIRSNSTTFQSTPPYLNGPVDTQQHEVTSGVIGAPWGQPHVSISPGGLSWKEERIVTASKTGSGGPEYLARFVALDDSGATHSLGENVANLIQGLVPGVRYSVDGSGLMLQPGTAQTGPVIVDRNGNAGGLIDHNGNAITLNGQCATPPGSGDFFNPSLASWEGYAHGTASATSITDSIGRVIPNPTYLPPAVPYSCIVDLDASYHPTNPNQYVDQITGHTCENWYFPAEGGTTVPLIFCYQQVAVGNASGQLVQIPTPLPAGAPVPNGGINTMSCTQAFPSAGNTLSCEPIEENWWVLKSVILPNQTSWQFGYDGYGQVSSVTMPTGATVTYSYRTRLACGNPPGQIPVTGTPVWPYSNIMSSRMVASRTLDLHDGHPKTWQYSSTIGSGWASSPNSGTVTVTDPNLDPVTGVSSFNDTVHIFGLQGKLSVGMPGSPLVGNEEGSPNSTCGPYETSTQYYQGSTLNGGTRQLLKEVDTAYSSTGTDFANPTNFSNYVAVGVFPHTVSTTIAPGRVNLVNTDSSVYDVFGTYQDYIGNTHPFSFGQLLSMTESDWGSGGPGGVMRTTLHTHLWQSNWNYYAANMIDLPCLDTVFAGSNSVTQTSCTPSAGQGTPASQTSYLYDESGYSDGLPSGNLTSISRWLNTSSTPLITHSLYTSASRGMPTQKIDAKGFQTWLTYEPCFGATTPSYLFLSKIQHPTTYTNGQAYTHIEQPTYDCNTGLLAQNEDENSQVTTYTYDSMRRLTGISFPDGGSEFYCYFDISTQSSSCSGNSYPPPSFTYTKLINSSNLSYFAAGDADTLGRVIHTQVSDPEGNIYKDTTYDNLGRVASLSNPYRSTTDTTYGVISFQYDALSRKVEQTQPDGTSKRYWCYSGIPLSQTICPTNSAPGNVPATDWVVSWDELHNPTQTRTDGLGRLVGVTDSISATTWYTYDVLGNLKKVHQSGLTGDTPRQERYFAYDSLSRLLSSFNPETGFICYGHMSGSSCQADGYDANGNLRFKTDARGITTGFAYDDLNRPAAKWYTGDTSGTPFSCYQYDGSSFTSASVSRPNLFGRLANAWTQKAPCPNEHSTSINLQSSSVLSRRSILGYDPMGRILNEQQCTYSNCSASTPYTPAYTYDFAGNILTHTSGIASGAGSYTFSNAYDAANRLAAVTSNASPGTLFSVPTSTSSTNCPYTSSVLGYSAAGGLQSATFGTDLQLTRTYDRRLRIDCEIDTGNTTPSVTPGAATIQILGNEQTH